MPPHSLTMTMIGASLLWVGWFGFNAGSNLEANGTHGAGLRQHHGGDRGRDAVLAVRRMGRQGQALAARHGSGAVAGLVAVTPASGFAGPMGSVVLGLVVSPLCLFFVSTVKNKLGYDDALDVFGVHCIGGIIGALGTGILVAPDARRHRHHRLHQHYRQQCRHLRHGHPDDRAGQGRLAPRCSGRASVRRSSTRSST